MITLQGLTKRYGDTTAVSDLTLTISPGKVTGFLGPNGAGKSTTMRMILGLDEPTSGTATIGDRTYRDLPHPLREVGALLEAKALHPRRSARNHLVAMARSNGIPVRRVDEVLDRVGLTDVARKQAGRFSLGMGQRLGIAGALLADPGVLMFDEPVNGLDPDGVLWVRRLMRSLADEGRTVFVSSHLMSEMQLTADHLVVIGRGRLIADAPIGEVIAGSSLTAVAVRVPDEHERRRLRDLLTTTADGVRSSADWLVVTGLTVEQVGDTAHAVGARLHALQTQEASLEEAYMELTAGSLDYTAGGGIMTDAVLAFAQDLMTSPWIYLALFAFAALDAFVPAFPSESLVIMAGVFAASGEPDLLAVMGAAALGAVAGDHVSYVIGRRVGRGLLRRLRPGTRRHRAFAAAQASLVERGGLVLVAARYVPGGRTAATLTMGAVGYRLRLFTAFTALAGATWGVYCALVGYVGGKAFEDDPLKGVLLGIGLALTLTAVVEYARHLRRRTPVRPVTAHEDGEPAVLADQGACS